MFPIPNFKGLDFFPHGARIPFMRVKGICLTASIILMVLSLGLFFTAGLNYGVDFKGGSIIELQSKSGPVDLAEVRSTLGGLGLGDMQIQEFGSADDILIRLEQQPGGEEAQQQALSTVLAALGDDFVQRRVEVVGAAVSSELRTTGTIAVLAALLAISVYVWFRFEWQFAMGAIIALAHDVLLTVGIFSLLQLSFDLSIVAALLTILGYSVNDTVVISDRIRENLRKFKRMELDELIDRSINETLSRTILTSGTTLVVLLALLFLGGEVIRNFTFAMILGVVIGTYSSMFIAAPMLGYTGIKREWSGLKGEKKSPAMASRA